METTIITEFLKFIGGSVASGLTWDLMKVTGKKIIDSFTKRFTKYFIDRIDAEEFLQYILETKVGSGYEAQENVKSCYDKKKRQQSSQDFINEFTKWLKENKTEFSNLGSQNGSITISDTKASGNAQQPMIVTQGNTGTIKITGINNK